MRRDIYGLKFAVSPNKQLIFGPDALMYAFASLQPLAQKVLLKEDGIMRYVSIINLFQLIGQDIFKGTVNFNKVYVTDASFQTRRILESIALLSRCTESPQK